MKKILIMLVVLGLMSGTCLASDNSARLAELKKEAQELIQKDKEVRSTLEKIQIRMIEINAIATELQKQDEPKKEKK